MNFVGRILSLVFVGLLLQFAVGPVARASTSELSVPSCTIESAIAADQGAVVMSQAIIQSDSDTAAQPGTHHCGNGISCTCPCHGIPAVMTALTIALPVVSRGTYALVEPRAFTQAGVHPPVRPPRT